ncbi:GNAT domain [Lasallia pustulata]|uniref:GNAT domain n=1 Tax=Lasallia pustulata TaxID=136370 RepID=A0A1W5CST9_9LECA|nr:GNAT domain [Lasallia pustulata]
MPRDFFAASQDGAITESPDAQTPKAGATTGSNGSNEFIIHRIDTDQPTPQLSSRPEKLERTAKLHPYVQTLSIADLDSCERLESSCFPEEERCTAAKFHYRLTTCPDLCIGLFSTTDSSSPVADAATYPAARAPDSFSPQLKSVLIAHVIATKTIAPGVTDESMEIPSNWQSDLTRDDDDTKGHSENGRTLALHSLAVLPAFQNQGLGKTILKSYMQRMSSSGVADRIALLAHDGLVKFYESVGYVNKGKSGVTIGGGGWNNLVRLINANYGLNEPLEE